MKLSLLFLVISVLLTSCTSMRSKTDQRTPIDAPLSCPNIILESRGVYRWPGAVDGEYRGSSTVAVPETVELVQGVLGNALVSVGLLVNGSWVGCYYAYDIKTMKMKIDHCDSTEVNSVVSSSAILVHTLPPDASGAQPKTDVIVRATFEQKGNSCIQPDAGK